MKSIALVFTRPWIVWLLLSMSVLVSVSTALRMGGHERERLERMERSLAEIRSLRTQVESPGAGLLLLSRTGVINPLHVLPEDLADSVSVQNEMSRQHVGAGLERWSITLEVKNLDPGSVGLLLSSLEGPGKGWWVTLFQMEAASGGLNGHLRLEALDKSPPEE